MAAEPRTVTVQLGDTLSGIALRELHAATAWPEIYGLNAEGIAAAQRIPGRERMRGPHWIFPGTTLKLPPEKTI